MSDIQENDKPMGLDALQAKLDEISGVSDDTDAENEEQEVATEGDTEVVAEEAASEPQDEEPKEEEKQEEEQAAEGDTEVKAETDEFKPTYQYKFQDEIHEFDDRVKAAIKSKEDEEFFKDLYTKASAMDLMKERAEEKAHAYEELQGTYEQVKAKTEENDRIVNYWSGLLEGLNRGDSQSFKQILNLAQVDKNSLMAMGETLAGLLENVDGYESQRTQYASQVQQQQLQQSQSSLQAQQARVEAANTELEIRRSLLDPEVQEIAKFVDEKWGEGSFEDMVWSEGANRQAQNPNISMADVPKIVREVAGKFKAFAPSAQPTAQEPAAPAPPVTKRVVNNTQTNTLPNVSGEQGTPVKPVYKDGAGLDGLRSRMKEVTGEEW